MAYALPRNEFEPHPAGRHTGVISRQEDKGLQDTPWGEKHKVAIYVESDTALMDDGRPFVICQCFTLSGDSRSNLRKFREAVLDRSLTEDEIAEFDPDIELVGRRISYRVDHTQLDDGRTRATIREGSVEPAEGKRTAAPAPTQRSTQAPAQRANNGHQGAPQRPPAQRQPARQPARVPAGQPDDTPPPGDDDDSAPF